MGKDKKKALELLKNEFIEIYTELEYLKDDESKNLEALYYSKIGFKEVELYQKEIEYLKLKREIELINSYINKGTKINLHQISIVINQELKNYYTELSSLSTKVCLANIIVENLVPIKKEISTLYKKLAKKLHPDFNEFTEELKKYWLQLQKYYSEQNFEGLKALEMILSFENIAVTDEEDIDKKVSEMMEKIKNLYKEKWDLLKTYPFNMKIYIEDENWIIEKLQSLEVKIEEFNYQIEKLKPLYDVLLLDDGGKIWMN